MRLKTFFYIDNMKILTDFPNISQKLQVQKVQNHI